MKYTETPLADIQPQLLTKITKITKNSLTICLNPNTKPHHKIYQNLFRKTILNLSKHEDLSVVPTEPASIQKLLLIDDEIQNHLTINKETDIPMLLLSTNLTLKSKRHMYFGF